MTDFRHENKLIHEKSPYLLQHAHDPVEWHPWGKEAFERAKQMDKPIFLSIGYATCHWCHVMERESFEDEEVAHILNEVFVNVMVDREELPEIDALYMELGQALMATAGGWPLNVILTPDLKPFFAVTYLPPRMQKELIGLSEFSRQIHMLWKSPERSQIIEQADRVVELFQEASITHGTELPSSDTLLDAMEELYEVVDPVFGGIRGEPKFPISYSCDAFLTFSKMHKESRALFYVELTLDRMHRGGIYDHLGGGFSRYAMDVMWHLPHFEKTLIDNSLLASTYLAAWTLTKRDEYKEIVCETLDYLLSHLGCGEGGFFSAEDADLERQEGLYYTWTIQEIEEVLEGEEFELFCNYYGVSESGNFEGRNVLHANMTLTEFAEALSIKPMEVKKRLDEAKESLKRRREERPRPFVDDKILCSSNGFAAHVFALAGAAFKESRYKEAACHALSFIRSHNWQEGRLLRRYRDGEARFAAGLDDYAALIKASLTLFETGCGSDYLSWAIEMTDLARREFKEKNGAFFQTAEEEEMLVRRCELYDGAEPSSNAVHAENLLRLYQMTEEKKYLLQAEDIFRAAKNFIESFPAGATYHLTSLQRYFDASALTFVIALNEKREGEEEILTALASRFIPNKAVIWKTPDDSLIDKLLSLHADKGPIEEETTLYLCAREHCEAPLAGKEKILERIERI